uniref:Uncharacterized protein n=1 Tax=Poecilia mexicana TaxID=48701 RepID=A0A3B3Y824_9TELE
MTWSVETQKPQIHCLRKLEYHVTLVPSFFGTSAFWYLILLKSTKKKHFCLWSYVYQLDFLLGRPCAAQPRADPQRGHD